MLGALSKNMVNSNYSLNKHSWILFETLKTKLKNIYLNDDVESGKSSKAFATTL